MTLVVSDTSPLHYLVQIKCEHLLPTLYERVLIPAVVLMELKNPRTPELIREWLQRVPEWLVVRDVVLVSDPFLDELDPGERHAIQLAADEHADLLLMDERAGVGRAREKGLLVTGTLGVLLQASERGLVDIEAALRDLQTTAFRFTPALIEEVRQRLRSI